VTDDGLIAITAGALTIYAAADADTAGPTLAGGAGDRMAATGGARDRTAAGGGGGDRAAADVHAVIRADEIVLARTASPSSARNSFPATVTSVGAGGSLRRIELDVGGTTLVAVVTSSSVAALALAPGMRVSATFKATAVHLC
jgi:molybdopterin-binding protein